ncbi:hypothetical protein V7S43_014531 [Phytophthora oleae]|uniref:Uncharacterized protein n=1 Tax=Phytophthora oleae TaxID=2107226 RepID=A0ABD3F0U3_9STRA
MVNRKNTVGLPTYPHQQKRIPTHVIRKEEARALTEKVEALQKQLLLLQETRNRGNVQFTESKNQALREVVSKQQLALASTSAMLFNHISSQTENPIKMHIHLPKQWTTRRETLVELKEVKFKQCRDYLEARCRDLDMTKDHLSQQRYEDADGNLIYQVFNVTRFRGKSLKQVYDALVFFMFNMEISISETLGDITVRDDYDTIDNDAYISNHRLVSKHGGVASEVNAATFAQYFNELGGSSFAMVATDSIDEDDLHPYSLSEFVRRDVSAAVMLSEEKSQGSSEEDEEVVVVLRGTSFMKIYSPTFGVPEHTLADVQERTAQWPKVMLRIVREMIETP